MNHKALLLLSLFMVCCLLVDASVHSDKSLKRKLELRQSQDGDEKMSSPSQHSQMQKSIRITEKLPLVLIIHLLSFLLHPLKLKRVTCTPRPVLLNSKVESVNEWIRTSGDDLIYESQCSLTKLPIVQTLPSFLDSNAEWIPDCKGAPLKTTSRRRPSETRCCYTNAEGTRMVRLVTCQTGNESVTKALFYIYRLAKPTTTTTTTTCPDNDAPARIPEERVWHFQLTLEFGNGRREALFINEHLSVYFMENGKSPLMCIVDTAQQMYDVHQFDSNIMQVVGFPERGFAVLLQNGDIVGFKVKLDHERLRRAIDYYMVKRANKTGIESKGA